jgi:hypothetical protein
MKKEMIEGKNFLVSLNLANWGRGPEGCHVGILHSRLALLRVAGVAFSAPTASRY